MPILVTQTPKYTNGFRYMYLENRYVSPKRLAIITYDCNRAVITCRLNIIVFDIEALNIDNKV